MKEFLEFMIPRRKFISMVNKLPLVLPNYTEILEFKEDGTIDMEALNDFLIVPYKNAQYNRTSVLRNISNKNRHDFNIDHFIRVAGKDDEFGNDALLSNKPRNATIVAEGEVILATLDRKPFEKILK
jgi:hypothetical protein